MLQKNKLIQDFKALGIKEGGAIGFHASYKALGAQVEGGAATLLDALQETLGPEGTLLLPCFTDPTQSTTCIALDTPCRLGYTAETFRKLPGVVVSNNHTHRCAARGALAKEFMQAHEGTSPLGRGSPFHELARCGGEILLLGCDLTSCSLIHVAESMAHLPFTREQVCYEGYDIPVTLIRTDGKTVVCPPLDNPGDSSAFWKVGDYLLHRKLAKIGFVAGARAILVRGNDVIASALDILSGDPLALLCAESNCTVCVKKRLVVVEKNNRQ